MKKEYIAWTKDGRQELTQEEWLYEFDHFKLHRLEGPAYMAAYGSKAWFVDGKKHRLDGPAIERVDGSKEWWIDGKYLPRDKVEEYIRNNNIDLSTEHGQLAIKLRWS